MLQSESTTAILFFFILVPDVGEILLDWDVVDPRLKLGVEELQPLVSNVKHQGTTEEEMLEAEAGSHTSEVEQIPRGMQAEVRPRGCCWNCALR